jgi:hypothetical protein
MHTQNHYSRSHTQQSQYGLPPPAELAGRLEEARTSAKLLEQVVMNTPPNEILGNELIREFADRCVSASRSIQGYMSSQNPVPDNDTMESLIDTNEQLQTALNQHQRAMLNARKLERTDSQHQDSPEMNGANQLLPRQDSALSQGSESGGLLPLSPPEPSGIAGGSGSGNGKGKAAEYEPPPGPPPGHAAALASGSGSASGAQRPKQDEVWDDPFADPQDNHGPVGGSSAGAAPYVDQRHAQEPYHPGFGGSGQRQRQPVDDDDIYDSPQQTKAPEARY